MTERQEENNPFLARANPPPVLVVELAERTTDITWVIEAARRLAAAGVDFISVPENPFGDRHFSSIILSQQIQDRAGIPVICHLTSRDRNLLALQSDLLGADAVGVKYLLALTGDKVGRPCIPVPRTAGRAIQRVRDVRNSCELIERISEFNEGYDDLGRTIAISNPFIIGASCDPNVHNIIAEVDQLKRKLAAGRNSFVKFVLSQIVFDLATVSRLYSAVRGLAVPVFLGLSPPISAKNLEFIHRNIVKVPGHLLTRMQELGSDRQVCEEEALRICADLADEGFRAGAPGFYIVTPFRRVELVLGLVGIIKARARDRTLSPCRLPRRTWPRDGVGLTYPGVHPKDIKK